MLLTHKVRKYIMPLELLKVAERKEAKPRSILITTEFN